MENLFSIFRLQNHLIHLGGKYAPCMRWDEVLDREITAERLKERDTACCVHKDGAGCVQTPKTDCSKISDPVANSVTGKSAKSKWVSDFYMLWLTYLGENISFLFLHWYGIT